MSKKLYQVAEKLTRQAVKKYGVEITFTQTTAASVDLALGKRVGETTTVFTGHGVKSNYKKSDIDGTNIKTGDIKILLENTDVIPKAGDEAAVNGSGSYRVMDVDPLSPAEETIKYNLQLRK